MLSGINPTKQWHGVDDPCTMPDGEGYKAQQKTICISDPAKL
jgi:hypothetical protein